MPQSPVRDTSAQVQRARQTPSAQSTPYSQDVSDRLLEALINNLRVLQKDATPQNIDNYTRDPYYREGYNLDKRIAEQDEASGEPREGFLLPAPPDYTGDNVEYDLGCSTDADCENKYTNSQTPVPMDRLMRVLLQRQQ